MNGTRAVMSENNFPPKLWGEILLSTAYLKDRTPTKSLKHKTPYEAYYGKRPDISHLHEIGCQAFVLAISCPYRTTDVMSESEEEDDNTDTPSTPTDNPTLLDDAAPKIPPVILPHQSIRSQKSSEKGTAIKGVPRMSQLDEFKEDIHESAGQHRH
ncbi:hypothetical protein K439DRAFT_1376090 [Ramaria rubella]|nr:hypothetical protein K439DRAFT_1376090 [Ramaria rubella]